MDKNTHPRTYAKKPPGAQTQRFLGSIRKRQKTCRPLTKAILEKRREREKMAVIAEAISLSPRSLTLPEMLAIRDNQPAGAEHKDSPHSGD